MYTGSKELNPFQRILLVLGLGAAALLLFFTAFGGSSLSHEDELRGTWQLNHLLQNMDPGGQIYTAGVYSPAGDNFTVLCTPAWIAAPDRHEADEQVRRAWLAAWGQANPPSLMFADPQGLAYD